METYAFWPAAQLLPALPGTPVLVWNIGWFTPGALPPRTGPLRDIDSTTVFLSMLALPASAVAAGASSAAAAASSTSRWLHPRATAQSHP